MLCADIVELNHISNTFELLITKIPRQFIVILPQHGSSTDNFTVLVSISMQSKDLPLGCRFLI